MAETKIIASGPVSTGQPVHFPLLAVAAVLLGASMANIDSRMFSIGLPDLKGAFSLSFDEGAWLSTASTASQIFIAPAVAWLATKGVDADLKVIEWKPKGGRGSLLFSDAMVLWLANWYAAKSVGQRAALLDDLELGVELRELGERLLHGGELGLRFLGQLLRREVLADLLGLLLQGINLAVLDLGQRLLEAAPRPPAAVDTDLGDQRIHQLASEMPAAKRGNHVHPDNRAFVPALDTCLALKTRASCQYIA